jgi:hypothetical protein
MTLTSFLHDAAYERHVAKLRYAIAWDAYEKACVAYIQVCDRFETNNADHPAFVVAWSKVVEASDRRIRAYDNLNRVYGGKA